MFIESVKHMLEEFLFGMIRCLSTSTREDSKRGAEFLELQEIKRCASFVPKHGIELGLWNTKGLGFLGKAESVLFRRFTCTFL